MEYLILFFVVAVCIWAVIAGKTKHNQLKRKGTKVAGIIINNDDGPTNNIDFYRFGGNINKPTVKFTTLEGQEIIGIPVIGFVSQREIVPPLKVYVFYNPKKPQVFCVDVS